MDPALVTWLAGTADSHREGVRCAPGRRPGRQGQGLRRSRPEADRGPRGRAPGPGRRQRRCRPDRPAPGSGSPRHPTRAPSRSSSRSPRRSRVDVGGSTVGSAPGWWTGRRAQLAPSRPGPPVDTAGGESPTAVMASRWNGARYVEPPYPRRRRQAGRAERRRGDRRRHPHRPGQSDREAAAVGSGRPDRGSPRRPVGRPGRHCPSTWPPAAAEVSGAELVDRRAGRGAGDGQRGHPEQAVDAGPQVGCAGRPASSITAVSSSLTWSDGIRGDQAGRLVGLLGRGTSPPRRAPAAAQPGPCGAGPGW